MMPHDVTQADREAAASLSDAVFCHPDIVAEAFTAHRLAAIAEERAKLTALVTQHLNGRLFNVSAFVSAWSDHIQEK